MLETETGKVRVKLVPGLDEAEGMIWSLAFSPTGRSLAVRTQQGPVEVWSLDDTSGPMLRLPGHRGFVASLAFSPQGDHLASAGSDRTVDLWDLGRLRAGVRGDRPELVKAVRQRLSCRTASTRSPESWTRALWTM
ncbi:MAG: hypothetical protein U0835_13650 [Isosphaeraceae bacterium]